MSKDWVYSWIVTVPVTATIFENVDVLKRRIWKTGKLSAQWIYGTAVGTVEARSGAVNENLATGRDWDSTLKNVFIWVWDTTVFPIEENIEQRGITSEIPRVGWPDLQKPSSREVKARVLTWCLTEEKDFKSRDLMCDQGVLRGARSATLCKCVCIRGGNFYALQSPQIFKQLFDVAGGYDHLFPKCKIFSWWRFYVRTVSWNSTDWYGIYLVCWCGRVIDVNEDYWLNVQRVLGWSFSL